MVHGESGVESAAARAGTRKRTARGKEMSRMASGIRDVDMDYLKVARYLCEV